MASLKLIGYNQYIFNWFENIMVVEREFGSLGNNNWGFHLKNNYLQKKLSRISQPKELFHDSFLRILGCWNNNFLISETCYITNTLLLYYIILILQGGFDKRTKCVHLLQRILSVSQRSWLLLIIIIIKGTMINISKTVTNHANLNWYS